jgi:hypothetical protein
MVMLSDALIQTCHECATTDNLMKVNKVKIDGDTIFLRYDTASTGKWMPVL